MTPFATVHRLSSSSWVTEDVEAVAGLASAFFEKEAVSRQARWVADRRVDREFWAAAGGHGLLGCGVPACYGGGGGTLVHDFAVVAALARTGVTPGSWQVHSVVVPQYIVAYGAEEQKQRWLPGLCAGRLIGAVAMTEPDAGSDLQSLRTRAVRDGDSYVLNGSKMFITNGTMADVVIVAASTDPPRRSRGISLFVVETAAASGFSVSRALDKIGQHESDTAELAFVDVRVPAENRLGTEGDGWRMLMGQLPHERLMVGVTAVATMERAVELAAAYTLERRAFGGRLIDLQHVRFELAECATMGRVARVFVDDCISRFADGELDDVTTAMAKWWLTEMECQVVDRCLQLFGGYGYMTEVPIARMYANARVQKIYGGTNEIMKEIIGRTFT
jgi:long-chain-acyl-CoA dehydrogenase